VRDGLRALVEETGADELIIVSDVFDHQRRLHSFELIAECAEIHPEPCGKRELVTTGNQ
jgi:hypothetical protein